jgi:hypothetical protein
MFGRLRRRVSPGTAIGGLALFVALGGPGWAATGGNFILGQANEATSQSTLSSTTPGNTLVLRNNATGATGSALYLQVPAGHAPLGVNSSTRVTNLNADKLDNFDSSVFVRGGVPFNQSHAGSGAVVDANNTGSANGVQGKTTDPAASGVYGEHVGPGGYGVAGRAGDGGNGIFGDNTGSGWAGYFEDKVHVGGTLELAGDLSCSGCISAGAIFDKVSDADRLDGIDSTGFIQGAGGAKGEALATAPGTTPFIGPSFGGLLRVKYSCPAALGSDGAVSFSNTSASVANLFIDSGGANPDYLQLGSGGFVTYPAAAGGESFHIQAQGAPGVLTLDVASVHRIGSNDCHAQGLGVLAR